MRNQKPNYNKPKITLTNYEKKYDNFFDMIDELMELHPEIKNEIFKNNKINNIDEATQSIIDYFLNNKPDIINKKNLGCSLSISANKILLRTNKSFSIGWKFRYDRGNVTDIVGYMGTTTRENMKTFEDITVMTEKLKETWTEITK